MTDDERKRLRAEAARKKAAAAGSGKTGAVKVASSPQASENKKKSAVSKERAQSRQSGQKDGCRSYACKRGFYRGHTGG